MGTKAGGPLTNVDADVLALCERIQALMWRRRLTQTALAPAVGVDQSVLSKKLRGQVPITVAELFRIADALRVDRGELLMLIAVDHARSG